MDASVETTDTLEYLMTHAWRAQRDTTLGGWCVTLEEDPRTPSEGALAIASFLARVVAEHIARNHNVGLGHEPGPESGPESGPGGPFVPAQGG